MTLQCLARRLAVLAAVLSLSLAGIAGAQAKLLSLSKAGNTLYVYDASTFEELGTYPVGIGPHEVITDASGRYAYAANYGNQQPGNSITVIDLQEEQVLTTIDLGPLARPHGLAEHEGKIYFTSEVAKAVGRIDVATNRVDWISGTGQGGTHMLAVSPTTGEIWTADMGGGTVTVINPRGSPGASATRISVPGVPEGIAVSPDGALVAVGDNQGGGISLIDAASREIVGTIETGGMPIRVGFTPDGRRLLATDPPAGVLRVFDLETREKLADVRVGQAPIGFVIHEEAGVVLVSAAQSGEIVEVNLESLEVTDRVKTGPVPDGIALARPRQAGAGDGQRAQAPQQAAPQGRLRLGVMLQPGPDGGVQIAEVVAESKAEEAGLQAGDVIFLLDGDPLEDPNALVAAVGRARPGQTLTLTILRGNEEREVKVTL